MTNQPIQSAGHIAAIFTLRGHHKVIVRNSNGQLFATCDTFALSQTEARAAIFATENGVIRMSIEGSELTR